MRRCNSKNTILPLALVCGVSLLPLATALVEFTPKPGGPAAKEFVNFLIEAKQANKSFGRPKDLPDEAVKAQYEAFAIEKGGEITADEITGKIASISLKDPILPGRGSGNRLLWTVGTHHDDGHGPQDHRRLADSAASAVKDWVVANNDVIGIDPDELGEHRTTVHSGGDLVQVSIPRQHKGVPVEGSQANFDVSHGNLIAFGLDEWGTIPSDFDVNPSITPEQAQAAVAAYVGFALMQKQPTIKPQLKIISMAKQPPVPGLFTIRGSSRNDNNGQGSSKFAGYNYKLVWQVGVNLVGQTVENFEAQVDARTSEVYVFQDFNDYLMEAKGGVFPVSNDGIDPDGMEQPGWPMPFMYVGSSTTDIGGNFDSSGTATFEGPYLKVSDNCGAAILCSNEDGVDWGASAGTDCTTPGYGGSGNTHSSRSVFYETVTIQQMSLKRLPDNNWLKQKLQANVNINSSCNAYWNGSVNFYRSGGGCSNTAEIVAVTDHEWGHGMDANDANPGIAGPSGEGIADLYAALRLGTSCIGRNFKSVVCSGNFPGDGTSNPCLTCSGVRDIDYLERADKTPQTFTVSNSKCGSSVHCKGYTYSEAVWSLYKRHLQTDPYNYDDYTALEIVTRLTYLGGGSVVSWYSGTPPNGGCDAGSAYKKFLSADDDNGDLTDGTPHMGAIFAAFNEHEIACNDLNVMDFGCLGTPTEQPIVTSVIGNKSVRLEWDLVTGAAGYEVLRSDGGVHGCDQGKFLLTGSSDGTTTNTTFWEDTGLQHGREYCYLVIPKGNSDSCYGRSSAPTLATPLSDPDPDFSFTCQSQELTCPQELFFVKETPEVREITCTITSQLGYASILSLDASNNLVEVTSTVDQASVNLASDGSVNIVVTVTSSIQVVPGQTGYVTVTADDGSKTRTSQIQVRIKDPQIAVFDQGYGAPLCDNYVHKCTSVDPSVVGGSLLNGRGSVGPEMEASNTIDNCTDGNGGIYHSDESLDAITVKRTDGDTTKNMAVGSSVTVEAKVYCWSTGSSDRADFYYTSNATNPSWTLIGTVPCPGGGVRTLSQSYVLPQGSSTQAVRVNFRYNGSQSHCSGGSYDDADDIVFAVAPAIPAPTPPPSSQSSSAPSSSSQPSPAPSSQPSSQPSSSSQPTSQPSEQPSPKPTSAPSSKPSSFPSLAPTPVPTPTQLCSFFQTQGDCDGTNGRCIWSGKNWKSGICEDNTPSPPTTPAPTSSSTPQPTGNSCGSPCSSYTGGGECRSCGCTWSQGSCIP